MREPVTSNFSSFTSSVLSSDAFAAVDEEDDVWADRETAAERPMTAVRRAIRVEANGRTPRNSGTPGAFSFD
jgi:hypothetical protein